MVAFAYLAAPIACIIAAFALAAPTYPELTGRIVDNANLLTVDDRAAIEAELASLEQASTDQIAVATVRSLEGYPIEDYGIGLARKWGIGQKDKDNGVVLLVAPNERKVRIEVGRRLEPLMTDTMSKLIIENAILPKFRRGDFSGGVRDGVRDIKAVLLGDAEEVKQRAKGARSPENDPTVWIHLIVFLAIIAFIIYVNMQAQREAQQTIGPTGRRRRSRRNDGGGVIVPGGSSDWGGGWSGGSGGGGGWSGGGGGFGGGGASGDW
ncbi:MAG: TPM domain-containing protein [Hyphomicrobium sp.]